MFLLITFGLRLFCYTSTANTCMRMLRTCNSYLDKGAIRLADKRKLTQGFKLPRRSLGPHREGGQRRKVQSLRSSSYYYFVFVHMCLRLLRLGVSFSPSSYFLSYCVFCGLFFFISFSCSFLSLLFSFFFARSAPVLSSVKMTGCRVRHGLTQPLRFRVVKASDVLQQRG